MIEKKLETYDQLYTYFFLTHHSKVKKKLLTLLSLNSKPLINHLKNKSRDKSKDTVLTISEVSIRSPSHYYLTIYNIYKFLISMCKHIESKKFQVEPVQRTFQFLFSTMTRDCTETQ